MGNIWSGETYCITEHPPLFSCTALQDTCESFVDSFVPSIASVRSNSERNANTVRVVDFTYGTQPLLTPLTPELVYLEFNNHSYETGGSKGSIIREQGHRVFLEFSCFPRSFCNFIFSITDYCTDQNLAAYGHHDHTSPGLLKLLYLRPLYMIKREKGSMGPPGEIEMIVSLVALVPLGVLIMTYFRGTERGPGMHQGNDDLKTIVVLITVDSSDRFVFVNHSETRS